MSVKTFAHSPRCNVLTKSTCFITNCSAKKIYCCYCSSKVMWTADIRGLKCVDGGHELYMLMCGYNVERRRLLSSASIKRISTYNSKLFFLIFLVSFFFCFKVIRFQAWPIHKFFKYRENRGNGQKNISTEFEISNFVRKYKETFFENIKDRETDT